MEQASYHHGDLRNSLVSIATEMLNEKGVAGISLREVARIIGVGHNAPYRHFRNKQELLEAISENGFRRLKAKNTRLELEFASDPEAQIFESTMHVINMAAEQPNLFELMFGGHIQPQNRGEGLQKASEEALQSVIGIIKNGQQLKVFVPGDPVTLALSTMSMIQGLAIMVSSGKLQASAKASSWADHHVLLRGVVLQLFEVILRGLKV